MDFPAYVDLEPPSSARTMFKVVALVDGMPTSIYDGLTVYPLGQTVFHLAEEDHRGGLYCFSTIDQCLARDEATFPRSSALLAAPRCILRVLAWNLRSAPAVPLAYGTKRAFSCVRAVAEIPMPNMSGWASRLLAGSHPRVAKTQARTLELEIEVAAMEERLRMARGLLPSAG